jgi:hypothetical protein
MSHPFSPRLIPIVATLIGFACILAAAGVAVSHFVYGEPVHDRSSGAPISTAAVTFSVILFGAAGTLLAGSGIRALRAISRRGGEPPDA